MMKPAQVLQVVILAGALAFSFANNTLGGVVGGVNLTNTITGSMDGGVTKVGNTWYERGANFTNLASGIQLGLVSGQLDPFSDYLFQPAIGNNTMMLSTNRTTGSLLFQRPVSVVGLSLAGASGNGTGTNVLTLKFSDATTSTLTAIVGDWFNNTNRLQTSNGRFDIFNNTFNNMNSDNPRVYAVNLALSQADQSKFLTGIDFSWTGSSTRTVTAIFGVSGDVTGIGHYTAIPLTPASFTDDMIVGVLEVPEPGTLTLVALGGVALLARARRNRN